MIRETKSETGHEKEYMIERGNTARQQWATPVMKSVIVTVNTKNVGMTGTATGRVERRRRGTERGVTERRKRDATSPHAAAAAEGGMTVKKATATENINTKKAKEAKRARAAVRRWAQTKKARRLWSDPFPSLFFFFLLSTILYSQTQRGERSFEAPANKTTKSQMINASFQSPAFISIGLHFVVICLHHRRQ